jgi:hypothetical protein
MAPTSQPHVQTLPISHGHRALVLGLIAALVSATIAIGLVVAIGGGSSTPQAQPVSSGFAGGPAADTASAVSQALRPQQRSWGPSLTTNVYAKPVAEAGPAFGTPAAVHDATSR